jgi:cation transport ATPase
MRRITRNYRFIVAFNTALIVLGLDGVIVPTTGAYLHNISTIGVTASNVRPLLEAPREN